MSSVSSVSAEEASLSPEQEQEVQRLVGRGFAEWAARQEVLARNHPLGCECEVCR